MSRPAVSFVVCVVLFASRTAMAGPLNPEACVKLKGQLAALDEQGVKALIDKGPDAAKGAASKEQLRQVRQYFDLLGSFRFRCPQETPIVVLKPVPLDDPADVAAAAAPIEAGSPGITLPAGVAAATVGPVVPSAPRKPAVPKTGAVNATPGAALPPSGQAAPAAKKPPAPKVAAPIAPAAPAPQAPPAAQAAPKPRPKPKTDDAFRPPAATSTNVTPSPAAPTPVAPAKAP